MQRSPALRKARTATVATMIAAAAATGGIGDHLATDQAITTATSTTGTSSSSTGTAQDVTGFAATTAPAQSTGPAQSTTSGS